MAQDEVTKDWQNDCLVPICKCIGCKNKSKYLSYIGINLLSIPGEV